MSRRSPRGGLVAELPTPTAVAAAVEAATDRVPGSLPPRWPSWRPRRSRPRRRPGGAGPLIGPGAWIATVQNGLGNDRALARAVGAARVVPGSTTVAAEGGGDGRVRIGESVFAGRSSALFGPPPASSGSPGPRVVRRRADRGRAPAHVDPDVDLVI